MKHLKISLCRLNGIRIKFEIYETEIKDNKKKTWI